MDQEESNAKVYHEHHHSWYRHAYTLLHDLHNLYMSQSFSDVRIKVRALNKKSFKTFQAHKVILSSISPMFKTRLSQDQNVSVVHLSGDVRSFEIVLDFVYSGILKYEEKQAKNLKMWAEYLALPRLAQLLRNPGHASGCSACASAEEKIETEKLREGFVVSSAGSANEEEEIENDSNSSVQSLLPFSDEDAEEIRNRTVEEEEREAISISPECMETELATRDDDLLEEEPKITIIGDDLLDEEEEEQSVWSDNALIMMPELILEEVEEEEEVEKLNQKIPILKPVKRRKISSNRRSNLSYTKKSKITKGKRNEISSSRKLNGKNGSNNCLLEPGEKKHLCSLCGRTLRGLTAYNRHLVIHSGMRPYACEICGKDFTQKQRLVVHQRKHTGERPYLCSLCGKTFTESCKLKRHLAKVHKANKDGSELFPGQPIINTNKKEPFANQNPAPKNLVNESSSCSVIKLSKIPPNSLANINSSSRKRNSSGDPKSKVNNVSSKVQRRTSKDS